MLLDWNAKHCGYDDRSIKHNLFYTYKTFVGFFFFILVHSIEKYFPHFVNKCWGTMAARHFLFKKNKRHMGSEVRMANYLRLFRTD